MEQLHVITSESHGTSQSSNTNSKSDDEGSPNLIRERTISPVEQNRSPSNDSSDDDDDEVQTDQELVDLPKKQKCHNKFCSAVSDHNEPEPFLPEEDPEEDFEVPDDGDRSSTENDVPIKQFTAPNFDDLEFETDYNSDTNSNYNDS